MNTKANLSSIEIENCAVAEPMAMYFTQPFLKSNVLLNLAQNSKELFSKLMVSTGLTIKTLAEDIFEITPKTFIKYKNNNVPIPSRVAEHAIELNTLFETGNSVLGSAASFNGWLDQENIYFNNKKPILYLNTSTGIHMVFDELKKIEFGATA